MYEFIAIVAVVFGVLQIILFFKIWGMTNDVRMMRNFFVAGVKPQDAQQTTVPTDEEKECKDYDKRLDTLSTGDEVILKSTNQRLKVVKTWGNEIIVNTPSGNECVAKHKLAYVEK